MVYEHCFKYKLIPAKQSILKWVWPLGCKRGVYLSRLGVHTLAGRHWQWARLYQAYLRKKSNDFITNVLSLPAATMHNLCIFYEWLNVCERYTPKFVLFTLRYRLLCCISVDIHGWLLSLSFTLYKRIKDESVKTMKSTNKSWT